MPQIPGRPGALAAGRPGLRVEAAHLHRVGDALDREQVGGGPHVDLLAAGHGQDLLEGLDHDLLELLVDDRSRSSGRG